ncbi:amidohydrolase family protein [Wenzhouxiangella marina]|nr:amidohydrolase family protein [Wenzhouxiangella marina]MBB6085901.1 imidazolonepropionase-like amidohydrolase [Wenzhouxiangella marina]
MNTKIQATLAATLLASTLLAAPASAEVLALTGATVHPVSSDPIPDGTVLIEDGRITAVGSDIVAPPGARIIDLDGLHLYPGFVHPASQLGLREINSVAGTIDTAEMGSVNAALRAEVAFNHDSMLLPASVAGGILSAHVVPGGGLIQGSSAVLELDGWSWEEMVLKAPVGMHMEFPPAAVDDENNEDLARIEQVLDQARHHLRASEAARAGTAPAPMRNDQLEALAPLLRGEQPLFIRANRYDVIEKALDWAQDQGFEDLVLMTSPDVQYLAERLARDGIPVILQNVYALPSRRWEPYDMAFVAAARLAEAGVQFAISDDGNDAANARNLPFQAGTAAAHGLDKLSALRSVTLWPAQILGLGDELGSIEVGKRASLFAASGDPLEPMTRIERVWIAGAEYDLMRDPGRRAYERYRERNRQAQGR